MTNGGLALQGSGKRARGGEHSSLDMSDEVGLWSEALRLVNAALKLSGEPLPKRRYNLERVSTFR